MTNRVLRMAAFPDGELGGNPAGVVLDAGGLDGAQMQRIAASVGYAETAFVTSALALDADVVDVRYFSPSRKCRSAGTPRSPRRSHWPVDRGRGG